MTDNLKLIILDAAIITFVIIIIIALLILKHKENKKNMNKDLKPGIFSGDPKDYETSVTNEIDLGKTDGKFDTIYLNVNHFILKDKTLDIEIDLKGKLYNFDKIVVDGIAFVKENKE